MYEYISGKIVEHGPAHVVIENNGLGYFISISLYTFEQIRDKKEVTLLVHEQIREDAYNLFGFSGREERELFRHLISVSGIGANTARMMLSSVSPGELTTAILSGNTSLLQGIKGIGAKTAQRVIIELKDKIGKSSVDEMKLIAGPNNTVREEALSALVMLGFVRGASQKAVDKILAAQPELSVEQLIKASLKML